MKNDDDDRLSVGQRRRSGSSSPSSTVNSAQAREALLPAALHTNRRSHQSSQTGTVSTDMWRRGAGAMTSPHLALR